MNVERLKYFLNLSMTLNYTETAERFYTTQSNISKQIIALENDLNTILFVRKHRKVSLTDAGKALVPYAEKILSDFNDLQKAIIPFQHSNSKILKICAIPVMANYNVTGLIAGFHHSYPDIRLDVREVESINLLKELDEGTCDIAYIRIFNMDLSKYEKITVEHDRFAAVLPRNHPLAGKDLLKLNELQNEIFYQLDRHTQLIDQFYLLCQKGGFKPNVGYTGTRIDNILDFVSNGMGISLMMQNSFQSIHYPGIVIIPLDITIESELAFIRPKLYKHSFASDTFWEYMLSKISYLSTHPLQPFFNPAH